MVTGDRFRPLAFAMPLLALLVGAGILLAGDDEKSNSTPAAALTLAPDVAARQESLFVSIKTGYETLKPIFERSCFDCHSTLVKYPWYYKVPGIKQLIDSDIKEGREHLELSNGFPFGGKGSLPEIMGDMKSEIAEGAMPLFLYRMMHWGTGLSGARRDSVVNWLDSAQVAVMRFYDQEQIPYQKPKGFAGSGE